MVCACKSIVLFMEWKYFRCPPPSSCSSTSIVAPSRDISVSMNMSPSPRDRLERAVKSQSMPIAPSVMQVISTSSTQSHPRQSQQGSPASVNMSPQSKRATPPLMTQAPGNVSKLPSPPAQSSHLREDVVQDHYPPPGPVHAHSQPNIHQPPQQPPPPMHTLSQPNIHAAHAQMNPQMGYPRPVNRIAPQFLSSFHTMEENWQMTDELMAEIERADYAQALSQQPAPGTAGVAYAGGAQSGAVYIREAPSPHKDSVMDRVRGNGRSSPKDADTGRRPVRVEPQRERDRDAQPNESVRARERPLPVSVGSSPQGHPQPRGMSPERISPPYLTPQISSAEGTPAGDFIPFKRDSYQPSHARIPTPPPTVRKQSSATVTSDVRTTPPAASKLASQTPPLQAMKTRTPDKSLPVQEEQEDDIALKKTSVHSQYDHRNSPHRDDDDDTLIENDNDNDNEYGPGDTGEDGGSGSYTPRSPSVNLPDPFPASRHYAPPLPMNQRVTSITKHHRAGSTDQLGLQSFDAIVNQKPAVRPAENQQPLRPQQSRSFSEVRDNRDQRIEQQQQLNPQNFNQNQRLHPLHTQFHADDQNYEDPAAAYLQMYLQSARPNAPIPPTPHSQTAAPSPSPLISSIQPSPAPVGSPYPFPFSHVRRNVSHAPPTAPSSTYDPAAIEEQIALQMQMYALNNQPALTDSTFSPSSTPFPGPGYNPWAFLQATRGFGGTRHRFDSMSMQSSPSHQPVSLPFPSSRGRGIKRREKSVNLRKTVSGVRDKVQPPQRVESTQPRDTSPEPYSSGEETAGEERYDVHEEAAWVNGDDDGDGEWVDESEDNTELIDLEYHPHYISNLDKRRRKWDARWENLQQAFQALDFETDTTMVLLAAPSHSTKFHALTSRFVRREQLDRSPAMANIRTAFKGIAGRRRAARAQSTSIIERLLNASTTVGEGSDAGSDSREGDLKRALETTLGSLNSLRVIYEQRVSRWEEEMVRIADERQRVELLLRQTLGVSLQQPQPNGPLLL